MSDALYQFLSSDGARPGKRCQGGLHVYGGGVTRKLEGTVCLCGKTEWRYKKCSKRGVVSGHAVRHSNSKGVRP